MQENEFEKQVKQRMDEFRLRPSEPVWAEIRKELIRKRRRRLLVLIPLFTALMAGGYFAWVSFFPEKQISSVTNKESLNNHDNKTTTSAIDGGNTNSKPIEAENDKNTNNTTIEKTADTSAGEKNNHRKIKESEIKGREVHQPITKNENSTQKSSKGSVITREKKKENSGSDFIAQKEKVNKEKASVEVVNSNSEAIDKSAVATNFKKESDGNAITEKPATVTNSRSKIASQTVINSVDNKPVSIEPFLQRKLITDSILSNSLANMRVSPFKANSFSTRKWKIGFTLAIGASSRTSKPLQIINSSSSADKSLALGLNVSQGGISNLASGGVYILPPSDIKPGAAFKAGLVIARSLSKRFDISSGLLYSYSSDHIQVGKSINSSQSASNYSYLNFDIRNQSSYASLQKSDYTNKYHFIELPVSVSYNLTHKWRIPAIVNGGVSFSQLISTNALLYDAAWGGIYYDGKKDINKTQANLSAGFSFRFGGKSNWQWDIGPRIYISATKLFNNASDENKHPYYGGLHMQLLFPAKKKSR